MQNHTLSVLMFQVCVWSGPAASASRRSAGRSWWTSSSAWPTAAAAATTSALRSGWRSTGARAGASAPSQDATTTGKRSTRTHACAGNSNIELESNSPLGLRDLNVSLNRCKAELADEKRECAVDFEREWVEEHCQCRCKERICVSGQYQVTYKCKITFYYVNSNTSILSYSL